MERFSGVKSPGSRPGAVAGNERRVAREEGLMANLSTGAVLNAEIAISSLNWCEGRRSG